jgi:hypothetical protein
MTQVNCNVGSVANITFVWGGNAHFLTPAAGGGASTIGLQHAPVFAFRPEMGLLSGSRGRTVGWQQLGRVPSLFGWQQEQPQQTPSPFPCAMAQQAEGLQFSSLWPSAQIHAECGSVARRNAGTRIAANARERRHTAISWYKRTNIEPAL